MKKRIIRAFLVVLEITLLAFLLSVVASAATGTMGPSIKIEDLQLPEVEGGPKLGDYVKLNSDGKIDLTAMTPKELAEGIKKFNKDNYDYYIDNNIPIDGVQKPEITPDGIRPPKGDSPSSGVEDSGTIGQSPGFAMWLTGVRRILYFGGSQYVTNGGVYTNYAVDGFDTIVRNMYNVMRGLGYCIMFVCWIFGMCKSGISLDFNPGAKGGIIRSGLTLMLGLFLMEVSMEIMESLSVMCWAYCAELYENADMSNALNALLSDVGSSSLLNSLWTFLKDQATNIMSWIIEAVLVLNVAYMGVLQCFSPIFVGFAAGGEGTRRFATGFFKEYVRVCLVPSFIVVYCSLCFHLFLRSSVNWFLCIVLGISVFSISKKLDKIIT